MLVSATLTSSVFAWNADTGAVIWSRTGTTSGGSLNYFWYDDCSLTGSLPAPFGHSLPFAGIVSTPVIDTSGSTPLMFVTSLCQTASTRGDQEWWLHEINLYDGHDATTAQQITGPASGLDNADDLASGSIPFNGWEVLQRPALLEVQVSGATPSHLIYVAFGSAVNETEVAYYLRDAAGWVFGVPVLWTCLVPLITAVCKGALL